MATKKSLKDLTSRQKKLVGVSATVQFALAGLALADIWRRPASEVRGSRALWSAACAVNFIGPLSYFIFGRRK
ncbi:MULTISPECIES: PLD nuclease N-terminal domain-containing protein [Arthrobacter]|uniref:PLD nuclease N-terminal domain-containing protein n=1 Tax=Arthrobacter sunyaminii TaxID=2816859 RepID=A0A975PFB3_9MICC|nr:MULTISPECIES: PLD nuclease N-terminal domain-containing protein [Arthrobacter]MBO0896871.1 PLDc_N domain-containing protein [Arthrobacter sunyaminii]MBO0909354.1 PLDc_N domain-containing protein [Arthrobacter sunyaminii]QWQ36321.1 PLD nuclease N-terminal domain-containing protein [Arthrobacter sunyaminii]